MTGPFPSETSRLGQWIIAEGLWFGRWIYLVIAGFLLLSGGFMTAAAGFQDSAYTPAFAEVWGGLALIAVLPILTSLAVWRKHAACIPLAVGASAVLIWSNLQSGWDLLDPTEAMFDRITAGALALILLLTPPTLLYAWSKGAFRK